MPYESMSREQLVAELRELRECHRALQESQSELEQSRSRYADLFDLAPMAYLTLDGQGRIQEVNRGGVTLLGRSREQLVGTPLVAVIRMQDPAPLWIHLRRCLEERQEVHCELTFTSASELPVVVQVSSVPVLDGKAQPVATRTVLIDITARRQAEADLWAASQGERRLRGQLESVTTAFLAITQTLAELRSGEVLPVLQSIIDQARTLTGASYGALGLRPDGEGAVPPWVVSGLSAEQSAQLALPPFQERLLALTEREDRSLRIQDLAVHPDFQGALPDHLRSLLSVPIRYQGQRLGQLYLVNKQGAMEFSDGDQRSTEVLAAGAGIAMEIARLTRAETRQRAWLQGVVEQMPEGVILLDERGKASFNQMALALSYEQPGQVDSLGCPVLFDVRMLSGEVIPFEKQPLMRAFREGVTVMGEEVRIRTADGSVRPMAAGAAPIRQAGRIAGAVAVFQDIQVLKELERLRQEWTAVIAHEFAQPLATISVSTGVLTREHDEQRVKQARAVDRIQRSLEQLRRMVEDLLDLSRLEARRLSLRRRWVDVPALLGEVVDRMGTRLEKHRVKVEVGGQLAPVAADPARLEQIVTNLLSNAAKYGEAGTEIEVRIIGREGELEVAVTNQGAGLSREELDRVFSRFYRSPSVEAGLAQGLGLGLYISKGLVEAHGGRIEATSTPGQSTTLRFTLPMEVEESA